MSKSRLSIQRTTRSGVLHQQFSGYLAFAMHWLLLLSQILSSGNAWSPSATGMASTRRVPFPSTFRRPPASLGFLSDMRKNFRCPDTLIHPVVARGVNNNYDETISKRSPRYRKNLWRRFLCGSSNERPLPSSGQQGFHWTLTKVVQALVVFFLSGIAEIAGGWLVWKAVREHKPWWWALLGSLTLVVYGFLPTLQPTDSFGRVYAVYGGFFIFLSYIWGMIFDGMKPDLGDVVGAGLALVAVLVILFWPRQQ